MQLILSHYSNLPGNHELVLRSLCKLLAEDPNGLEWTNNSGSDWDLLGRIAREEGVAALAFYLLRHEPERYQAANFDPRTYQDLSEIEGLQTLRNALLFRHLAQALSSLSEQNIPVVLLKGADVAHSLYPEPGLRAMTDLDLLIPPAWIKNALAIVNRLGYQEYLPEASPGLDQFLGHHFHLRKNSPAGPLLELHWTLIASPAFQHSVSMDWFWENIEPCQEWNQTLAQSTQNLISRLNPTANLLYLSAHLMLQHGGERASLRWLLDIQRLLSRRKEDIDWRELAVQANHFGWSGALRAALEAVQFYYSTPLPDGFLTTLQAQAGSHDRLIALKSQESSTRILNEWKKLRSLGWQGRIRLFIALLFPGREYMKWRYQPQPAWTWPIYYIYRWFDIAVDGFRTIFTVLRSPSKFV